MNESKMQRSQRKVSFLLMQDIEKYKVGSRC